jgi:hypothetical protein
LFATTAAPDKAMTSLFALGWTQHSVGAQNIRNMAMVQLLLGNIGVAGGGMNALRGHSNIQGLTDVGLLSAAMPGYLVLPQDHEPTFAQYMETRQYKPLRPDQTSYWQNYRKFFVSFQKAIYGDAARTDNDWAYDWLPKVDNGGYDTLRAFEMMANGQINGYICQGFNPMQAFPDRGKIRNGLSKLKFLVVMARWIPRHRGSGRTLARRTRLTRPASKPKSSSCRRPALPRRTGRWSIRPDGCNGIGERPMGRAKPNPISGSCPASSTGCAKCTARMAVHSPTRS